MATAKVGTLLLRNRYEITGGPHSGDGESQVWEAFSDGYTYLLKTWTYEGGQPDRVQRAVGPGAADPLQGREQPEVR